MNLCFSETNAAIHNKYQDTSLQISGLQYQTEQVYYMMMIIIIIIIIIIAVNINIIIIIIIIIIVIVNIIINIIIIMIDYCRTLKKNLWICHFILKYTFSIKTVLFFSVLFNFHRQFHRILMHSDSNITSSDRIIE